jgi:glutamyl-tRNA synthetase
MKVRTRFAPSPTGFMHVGSIRTALFAWAIAKHQDGTFILRIEDTDTAREVPGSVEHIIESLDWLGLHPDEGPSVGGDYGPYKQSERLALYREYAQRLIDNGHAYVDTSSPGELQQLREQAQAAKRPFLFREYRPEQLTVPEDWYKKYPLRFKIDTIEPTSWHDEVRGELKAGEDALDDFIIIKADGYPTYNFAHIVDDDAMEISHVVRGEEFIASVPKYLKLYQALAIEPPLFVTVPPILNANGGKKLSKRDGARDVLEYRDAGYSPDAIANFLSSLGWNDGTKDEIFTLQEIKNRFTIDRIHRSGAKFDETKLDWIQWQHTVRELHDDPIRYLKRQQLDKGLGAAFLTRATQLALSKSSNASEFAQQMAIFTDTPTLTIDDDFLKGVDASLDRLTAKRYLTEALQVLVPDQTAVEIEEALRNKMAELEAKPRAFLNLVRWVVSCQKVSPNLFEMIEVIGFEAVQTRIQTGIDQC